MIRMLTSIGGTPAFAFGEIAILSPEIERAWIAAGYAEPYDGDKPIEAATVTAPERAARTRKPRGRMAV